MDNKGLQWLRSAALDRELSSGVFNTLVLVWLDCWDGVSFHWSRPLSIPALADAWDIHRGTVWRHIERLADFGWIEVDRINPKMIRLRPGTDIQSLLDGRVSATASRSRDGVAESRQEEESISLIEDINLSEDTTTTGADPRHGREDATTENSSGFHASLEIDLIVAELMDAGVFRNVALQLAWLPHVTHNYVGKWIEYIQCDEEHGIGWAVTRMQSNDPVPEYCLICGGIKGGHKSVMTSEEGFLMFCPTEDGLTNEEIRETYGDVTRMKSKHGGR